MIMQYSMGDKSLQKAYNAMPTKIAESMPFAVTCCGDFVCDNKYFVKRKGMEQCLLLYTLEGEGIVKYENCEYTVRPGQVMVLDCRKYHYYATKADYWHFLWIHYQGKCAYDYERILNSTDAAPFAIHGKCKFREYFSEIASYIKKVAIHSELEIAQIMQNLMTDLIRIKQTENFSHNYGRYQTQIEKNIVYLHEKFGENISVEELARECGLSVYYYIKVFRAYTGQTPYDYLIDLRLQKARNLLIETNETVEVVALSVGFSESKNFIACFKKRLGITPLQFRKQAL